MVSKQKIFKRYQGTDPLSCLHLAFLVQRDLKEIDIPIPKKLDDKEELRYCKEQFLRYAKIVETPEEGDLVFFVDSKNESRPHIGTIFKDSKGKDVVFHSGDGTNGQGFRARVDPLEIISRPFDIVFYINFDKKNPGVDPKDLPNLEDAGFVDLILAIASIIAGATIETTAYLILAQIAIATIGYLYHQQQAEDQAEANRFNTAQSYSLTGTRNSVRPYENMAVVCGRYRMVPTLGAVPYTRTIHRELTRWYGILHLGVNDVTIPTLDLDGNTIDPIRVGPSELSDISDSSVRSLSGPYHSQGPFPASIERDTVHDLTKYNSIAPTSTQPETPSATGRGRQRTNFVYRTNPTILSHRIFLAPNRSVRLQIPAGTYIISRMERYYSKTVEVLATEIQLPGQIRGEPNEVIELNTALRSSIVIAANGLGGTALVSEGHPLFPSTSIVSQVESSRYIFNPPTTGNTRTGGRDVSFRNFNPGPDVDLLYATTDLDITFNTPTELDPTNSSGSYDVWMFSHPGASQTRVFREQEIATTKINDVFSENTVTLEGQEFTNSDWRIFTIEAPTGLKGIEFNTGVRLSRQDNEGRLRFVDVTMDVRIAYGGTNPRVETNGLFANTPSAGLAIDGASWNRPGDLTTPFVDGYDDPIIQSTSNGSITFRQNNPAVTFPRNWAIRFGNFQRRFTRYHIAFRRRDAVSNSSSTQNRFFISGIVGHRLEDQTDYSYQNRLGILLEASESLQGSPGRITVEVQGRCPIVDTVTRGGVTFRAWRDLFNYSQALENEATYASPNTFYHDQTSNPAAWFRHFLLGRRNSAGELLYGLGLPPEKIDHTSLREWYEYCENPRGRTGTVPRDEKLQVNCVYEAGRTNYDVLLHLAGIGEARITEENGKIGVWIDRAIPGQTSRATFTEDDIVADSFRDVSDSRIVTDGIAYEFHDRDSDYILQTEVVPNPAAESPSGAQIRTPGLSEAPRSLNLFGVTNATQARRAAVRAAHLAVARNRKVRVAVSSGNFHLTVGDIVTVEHRSFGKDEQGMPRSEQFIIDSIKYRDIMMELGLLRNSLPPPSARDDGYLGPVIPTELLPLDDDEHTDPPLAGARGTPTNDGAIPPTPAGTVDLTIEPDVVEGAL